MISLNDDYRIIKQYKLSTLIGKGMILWNL